MPYFSNLFNAVNEKHKKLNHGNYVNDPEIKIQLPESVVLKQLKGVFFTNRLGMSIHQGVMKMEFALTSNKDIYFIYKIVKSIQVEDVYRIVYGVLKDCLV